MDFHFTKQSAQLSLSNGHFFIGSQRFPNPIKEPEKNKFYFELELNCDPVCEHEFLQLNEAEFPERTQISASLLNFDYPYADIVDVERQEKHMHYKFAITLIREHWQHKISLHSFIPEFIHALNKNNLKTKLDYEEDFGCYLSVYLSVPASSDLKSRIKTVSRKIANTQQQVLLSIGE